MKLPRRQFLGTSIAAAAGAAGASLVAPGWLSRAFAQDRACGAACDEAAVLAAAFRRAQQLGKPLLVFVIPVAPGDRYVRGGAFGELLNHGGDAAFARLAMAEIACAQMSSLRTLVPQVGAPSGAEPLFVLVETSSVPARATPFTAELPAFDPSTLPAPSADAIGAPNVWQHRQAEVARLEERAIDERIGVLRGLLDRALAPDGPTLVRRAVQARARLSAREVAAVDALLSSGGLPAAAVADRAAAIVAVAASRPSASGARQRLEARLAQGARARLRDRPVPGSRWAVANGCGSSIEGAPNQTLPPCGMGHVAERSRRFLYFFSESQG